MSLSPEPHQTGFCFIVIRYVSHFTVYAKKVGKNPGAIEGGG
jgi:hypothetical protein